MQRALLPETYKDIRERLKIKKNILYRLQPVRSEICSQKQNKRESTSSTSTGGEV